MIQRSKKKCYFVNTFRLTVQIAVYFIKHSTKSVLKLKPLMNTSNKIIKILLKSRNPMIIIFEFNLTKFQMPNIDILSHDLSYIIMVRRSKKISQSNCLNSQKYKKYY